MRKETGEEKQKRLQNEEKERQRKMKQICNDLFGPFERIQESYLSMKFGQIPPKYHPHPKTIARVRSMDGWPTSARDLDIFYAYCYECMKRSKIHTTCKSSMKAITGSCEGISAEATMEYMRRERRKSEQEDE